jgi:hypothetical protein
MISAIDDGAGAHSPPHSGMQGTTARPPTSSPIATSYRRELRNRWTAATIGFLFCPTACDPRPISACVFRLALEDRPTLRTLSDERRSHRATRCTAVAQPSRSELSPSARLPRRGEPIISSRSLPTSIFIKPRGSVVCVKFSKRILGMRAQVKPWARSGAPAAG